MCRESCSIKELLRQADQEWRRESKRQPWEGRVKKKRGAESGSLERGVARALLAAQISAGAKGISSQKRVAALCHFPPTQVLTRVITERFSAVRRTK